MSGLLACVLVLAVAWPGTPPGNVVDARGALVMGDQALCSTPPNVREIDHLPGEPVAPPDLAPACPVVVERSDHVPELRTLHVAGARGARAPPHA